ncbi:MAG: peptidylprolyl isomerase [Methylobacterium sp.]|jgi:peptidylprolyl isomerase|nr:peptidylprolyl isomerase [Methylobacterium sp.]MCA3655574.1 peptidylprolyl isomerase [Methylobacterium sp.]MCA3658359.1 peptidylprolyl isomerase [Methylobacterium sp.]MCA3660795.1 peptidylprolyl isomerase [Methylobacterium sp.]MCA3662950.1 peptidylprolyl isomerase [Methylobacterium sp.]
MLRRSFLAAALAPTFALAPSFAFAQAQPKADPENTLVIELKSGRVVIALRPDLAPKHVERIKMLARKGFYDGIVFHRVLDGFMAQTGDPTGTGMGGSDLGNLPAEFSRTERYVRGTVGMARTQDPNSANSQFFIMFAEAPGLNGQYTIWGRVVEGMEHVDRIRRVDPQRERVPKEQLDKMIRVRVAADIR